MNGYQYILAKQTEWAGNQGMDRFFRNSARLFLPVMVVNVVPLVCLAKCSRCIRLRH